MRTRPIQVQHSCAHLCVQQTCAQHGQCGKLAAQRGRCSMIAHTSTIGAAFLCTLVRAANLRTARPVQQTGSPTRMVQHDCARDQSRCNILAHTCACSKLAHSMASAANWQPKRKVQHDCAHDQYRCSILAHTCACSKLKPEGENSNQKVQHTCAHEW